jgi:hypothetical protein
MFIPHPGSEFFHPDRRKYFNHKKALGNMIMVVHSGSRIRFFTYFPGQKGTDPWSGSVTLLVTYAIWCQTFLFSHKFHKLVHYFRFEVLKKKILANFQRILELFTQKTVTKLSKVWVWDPRSGIRKKPIPDPGSRIQGSKRHRIPDPDPLHCFLQGFCCSGAVDPWCKACVWRMHVL